MKKLLIASLVPLAFLCACNDDSGCYGTGPNSSEPPILGLRILYINDSTNMNLLDELGYPTISNISSYMIQNDILVDSSNFFWGFNPSPEFGLLLGFDTPSPSHSVNYRYMFEIPGYSTDTINIYRVESNVLITYSKDSIALDYCTRWGSPLLTIYK